MSKWDFIDSLFPEKRTDLFFILGPCVIESEELNLSVAEYLSELSQKYGFPIIYKSSFDKANRTSVSSYRGPGIERGLEILKMVKEETGLPVLTDVHETWQVEKVAEVVDIIQIPAFLCRQTDLLLEVGRSGKIVNIKKGQFMAPEDMKYQVEKIYSTGNEKVMVTERGTTFGYHNLVVDFRSILIMREFGIPVVFDATHSVQRPGGGGGKSSGNREFAFPLARAAVAVGADAIFMEVHPDPEKAFSDGPNSVYLKDVEFYLKSLVEIKRVVDGQR